MGFALPPRPDSDKVCIHRLVAGLLAAVLFERAGQAHPRTLHEEADHLDRLADAAEADGLEAHAEVYRQGAQLIRRAVAEGTIAFGASLVCKAALGVARG